MILRSYPTASGSCSTSLCHNMTRNLLYSKRSHFLNDLDVLKLVPVQSSLTKTRSCSTPWVFHSHCIIETAHLLQSHFLSCEALQAQMRYSPTIAPVWRCLGGCHAHCSWFVCKVQWKALGTETLQWYSLPWVTIILLRFGAWPLLMSLSFYAW